MNLLSKKEFSNPAADFRPICFWSLNDRLESATMRAAGWQQPTWALSG